MSAISRQKMETHAGVTYSVQLTKIDGFYYPRLVILSEPNLIIDACIILHAIGITKFRSNPFSFCRDFAVGIIDSICDTKGKDRLISGEIQSELGIKYLEKKLLDHRQILLEYKKLRSGLLPITEEFKERVSDSAEQVKFLQRIISDHYMSERYAGRKSTDN
jgi:hypothetical protein